MNPSAELLFGHSSEFLSGKKCTELFGGMLECFDSCPVEKSLSTGRNEVLVVDGVIYPQKLIETFPYNTCKEKLVLAIIHSVPEVDRNKALRRDFAALLNKSATLKKAAPDIVNTMKSLTSVSVCGVYVKSNDKFNLFLGEGAPEFISESGITSPSYLSGEMLPFTPGDSFPDGAAIVPVVTQGKKAEVLLFVGRGTIGTKFRNRLEMMASVLESCIARLTF